MRKSLRNLIDEEHWAIQELETCGRKVEYLAEDIQNCSYEPFLDKYKAKHEEAIEKRDAALADLQRVRQELKEYLLDIIN